MCLEEKGEEKGKLNLQINPCTLFAVQCLWSSLSPTLFSILNLRISEKDQQAGKENKNK